MEILTNQEKLNSLLCLQKEFEAGNHRFLCVALGILGLSGIKCLFIERLITKELHRKRAKYYSWGFIGSEGNLLFHPSDKQSRIDLINRWISEYK